MMLDAEPARFFIFPCFGAKGWIGIGLEKRSTGAKLKLSFAAAIG